MSARIKRRDLITLLGGAAVLNGLRYKYEAAGGIWEYHDRCWGATPP